MALVLGLLFNDAVGSSVFTDQAGKTVTASGGVTNVDAEFGPISCSGDIAAEFLSNAHQLSIAASADFQLPGAFSIGIAAHGYGMVSGIVFQLGAAIQIHLSEGSYSLVTSAHGTHSLGSNGPRPLLITRDASNTLRLFNAGYLVATVPGVTGNFGSTSDPILIGGGDFRGLVDDAFIYNDEAIYIADYTPALGIPEPAEVIPPYAVSLDLSVTVARRYAAALPLLVSVSDARVFDSSVGKVTWSARVIIGGVDLSSRLAGEMTIDAAEDAARIAVFSLTPVSAEQLAALEGAEVSIDISVSGGGYGAARRRFAGVVESVRFSAASRLASLTCRDQYQDRIRAAASADDVFALLGNRQTVSEKIAAWTEPASYFSAALDTVAGATFIDGAGVWRAIGWDIGSPARAYAAADMFDPGPVVETAQRAELPSAVVATLSHRFPRLHNAELTLTWEEPERVNYLTRLILPPTKSMVAQVLESLGDWFVKGSPVLESPAPGSYPVIVAPITAYYYVHESLAPLLIRSLSATVYRRWYQEVERNYRVTVNIDGLSGRDESIRRSVSSTFDSAGWETGRKASPSLGIYTANAPAGSEDDPEPTGYEALQGPWPPANNALDHLADMTEADVILACRHVVAEATRKAAQWRRRQQVSFSRPADLRLEVGEIVGISAYGVACTGQLARWSESFDLETGACVGEYVFAAPDGNSASTGFSATIELPETSVPHAVIAPILGNHIGADVNTPDAWVNPDLLAGYLCNTLPTSDFYDETAPTYEPQFRIVLPEIPADVRDPATEDVEIDATIALADAGLTITF